MRHIVITGGNRGLGEGVAKHFLEQGEHVCVTVRNDMGKEMVQRWSKDIAPRSGALSIVRWDAERPEDIGSDFALHLSLCDVLVNNAGWEADLGMIPASGDQDIFLTPTDVMMKALLVNMEAPRVLMGRVMEGMKTRGYGRIVNLASARAAQYNRTGDIHVPAYRLSKGALVLMTQEAAAEHQHPNIKFNALCPGWCKTRMGGPSAPEEVGDGVRRIVELCNLDENGPHGHFFIQGQPVRLA